MLLPCFEQGGLRRIHILHLRLNVSLYTYIQANLDKHKPRIGFQMRTIENERWKMQISFLFLNFA